MFCLFGNDVAVLQKEEQEKIDQQRVIIRKPHKVIQKQFPLLGN